MVLLSCLGHIGRTPSGERKPAPPAAHIVAGCGDRSGSMQSMGGSPPLQFHEQMLMLANTGKELGVPTIFSLVTFDDKCDVPIESLDLTSIPNDELPNEQQFTNYMAPRGMTALYDSGLITLMMLERQVEKYRSELPASVRRLNPNIVSSYVLLTDGADNSSKRGSFEAHVFKLNELRASGTMAIFLGANIDAATTGVSLGFDVQASIQVDPTFEGAECVLRSVSHTLQRASTGDDSQQVNLSPVSTPRDQISSGIPANWNPPRLMRARCLRT